MKYIDAEKLIAEIKRMLYFDNNWIEGDKKRQMRTSGVSSAYYKKIGSKHACESILDFITSLQQEQPEVDLDALVNEAFDKYSSVDGYGQLSVSFNRAELYSFIKEISRKEDK